MLNLMDDDRRKKIALAIVSKKKEDGSEEKTPKPKSDRSVAKRGAMESFLSAVDRKDCDGMMSALGSFHDLHSSGGDDDESEDEASPASEMQKGGALEQTKKEWS